ncbi:MAG: NAD(P)-binding domain-containing protein [Deltaproteobacteria bacterium]|nr:NAD(P)-binding domain-containing protein [Deltaproteobacteria bacterium]
MTSPGSVAVLGPGPVGALLARLAAANGCRVAWWAGERPAEVERPARKRGGRDAVRACEGVVATPRPEEALGDAGLVFLAVPAGELPGLLSRVGAGLTPDRLVVHAAKGLDGPAGKRPSERIDEETAARRVGALAGPYLVAEVLEGYATTLVLASRFDEVHSAVRETLASEGVRVQATHDLLGVELASAAAVALGAAAGLCAGLKLGVGARAVLLARGLAEATRVGTALGAKEETFGGPAGVADLLVTAGDPDGLGFRFGRRVGAGEPAAKVRAEVGERTEAVRALEGLRGLAARARVPAPTLGTLCEALIDGADAGAVLDRCLRGPAQE